LETPQIRVLVVDDYEPFRQFICSTLRKRSELQIVGEVSDGLEAVNKVEELQPDLIVLDIGLPSLNGIEAARRIRKVSPKSKILFVSQESSADVVQEALSLGARGYLVKAHAGNELLGALEAILAGRQFLSSVLSHHNSIATADSKITRSHDIEFYSDDAAFVVGFVRFIEAALEAGNAVITVTTESHLQGLLQRLREHGVDIDAAVQQGRYVPLHVADTLSTFMVNDLPDPARFCGIVGDLIAAAARTTLSGRVAICGECGSILWAQGKADAAIQVEQLCNQLAKRYEMDILCGFSLSSFYREEDKQIFEKICRE
jgi:DNA-binding NarL/FixJ family response regulator